MRHDWRWFCGAARVILPTCPTPHEHRRAVRSEGSGLPMKKKNEYHGTPGSPARPGPRPVGDWLNEL